jgi:hypothetical protein
MSRQCVFSQLSLVHTVLVGHIIYWQVHSEHCIQTAVSPPRLNTGMALRQQSDQTFELYISMLCDIGAFKDPLTIQYRLQWRVHECYSEAATHPCHYSTWNGRLKTSLQRSHNL